MTERKIELPKQTCPLCSGSGSVSRIGFSSTEDGKKRMVERSCHLCKGTGDLPHSREDLEAQLLTALAKIADMEALLREMRETLTSADEAFYGDLMKRVDALLAEGL